jgi:hypothetical protein
MYRKGSRARCSAEGLTAKIARAIPRKLRLNPNKTRSLKNAERADDFFFMNGAWARARVIR